MQSSCFLVALTFQEVRIEVGWDGQSILDPSCMLALVDFFLGLFFLTFWNN